MADLQAAMAWSGSHPLADAGMDETLFGAAVTKMQSISQLIRPVPPVIRRSNLEKNEQIGMALSGNQRTGDSPPSTRIDAPLTRLAFWEQRKVIT